jgi:hypothetical protein
VSYIPTALLIPALEAGSKHNARLVCSVNHTLQAAFFLLQPLLDNPDSYKNPVALNTWWTTHGGRERLVNIANDRAYGIKATDAVMIMRHAQWAWLAPESRIAVAGEWSQ